MIIVDLLNNEQEQSCKHTEEWAGLLSSLIEKHWSLNLQNWFLGSGNEVWTQH